LIPLKPPVSCRWTVPLKIAFFRYWYWLRIQFSAIWILGSATTTSSTTIFLLIHF
jgi:hypothetical protein